MNERTLVISPHIDDEVLGCYCALHDNAHVMECGVDKFHVVNREERLKELEALAKYRKFTFNVFENKVNNYVIRDLIHEIEDQINLIKPDKIFIPYPSYNQDHVTVYDAALVALRHHDINHFVKKVVAYEEVHSFLWDYTHDINSTFKGNYFVPIDIEDKIKSYKFLKSQVRGHRSPEMLRLIARMRGVQGNFENAEAFQILRWVD
jgi:LmbE family N-acetylglucosaminyl deacetylase